jgi:hypothetical protein
MLAMEIALDTVLAAAAAVGDEDIVSSEEVVFPAFIEFSCDSRPCCSGAGVRYAFGGVGGEKGRLPLGSSFFESPFAGVIASFRGLNLPCSGSCVPSNKYVSSVSICPSL